MRRKKLSKRKNALIDFILEVIESWSGFLLSYIYCWLLTWYIYLKREVT
jgi:hypothetical protein